MNKHSLKTLLSGALVAALSLSAGHALAADCAGPDLPVMPDGATATMEDMLAGQKAVKAFQSTNMDYMKCLEETFEAARSDAKDGADAMTRAKAKEVYETAIEAYNAAVSAEEEIAGAFNVELRAYNAANAKD